MNVNKSYHARNLVKVVEYMIAIVDSLYNYEQRKDKTPDQVRMLEEASKRGKHFLRQFLNSIAKYNPSLMVFAYELRMADNAEDKYTKMFLGMITPAHLSPLLKDIILANRRSETTNELVWGSPDRYKLLCGQEYQFVMKYKDGKPYVILDESATDAQPAQSDQWPMQIFNTLNNLSALCQRSYN